MKEVVKQLSTKRRPVALKKGRPSRKEPLVFKVVSKKAKPLGEVDYQAKGLIQVGFPYTVRQVEKFDTCWVRIQTGNFKAGTGVLTECPKHSPQYKLGEVIRFKKSRKFIYALVVPKRVHAANQLLRLKAELVSELTSAMLFNPSVRK